MNEVMWVVLSEWNGINTEVKAFCEWWAIYDSLRDIYGLWLCEGGKEYLRLDECGLKIMSGELEES